MYTISENSDTLNRLMTLGFKFQLLLRMENFKLTVT